MLAPLRHPITRRLAVLAILSLSALTTAFAAPEFPFNGSFELVAGGTPVGWVTEGGWLLRPDSAVTGKNGITLRGDLSRKGMEMVTGGYLLAAPGDRLSLSFTYTSDTGGPTIVLVYCDPLGRPMAEEVLECLPPLGLPRPLRPRDPSRGRGALPADSRRRG